MTLHQSHFAGLIQGAASRQGEDLRVFLSTSLDELPPIATFGTDGPYDGHRLNEQERALLMEHPIDGLRAIASARASITLAHERYESACLFRGNGDAFRHALWNALMTQRIGAEMAEKWGNAHEYGAQPVPPQIERDMDLANNEFGRGIVLPSEDEDQAADVVQNSVRGGELTRIVSNTLVPTNGDCEL